MRPAPINGGVKSSSTVVAWVVGVCGALCAAVLVAAIGLEDRHLDGPLAALIPPCPAAEAGTPCAACGLSHAFVAMAHGRVDTARTHHVYGPEVFSAFVALALVGPGLWLGWLVSWRRSRRRASSAGEQPSSTDELDDRNRHRACWKLTRNSHGDNTLCATRPRRE